MRYLLLSVLVACMIGVIIPSVFADGVNSTSSYGTVNTEKSQYEIMPKQTLYVKVFGTVENPGDRTTSGMEQSKKRIYFDATNPDGMKISSDVMKTSKGYYENFIIVNYDNLGKWTVNVTYDSNFVGSVTFWVVDKNQAEKDRVEARAAAQIAADAKIAAQAEKDRAEVKAAEARAAAQAAAEARAAAQAAAEVKAAEARAAAEAKAAAAQAAAAIIVLAIIATIIVVIAVMARKSRKNQIDQIKQTNDVMSASKEEKGVMFCSDCGNRLTKADAKFCKKCGSMQ